MAKKERKTTIYSIDQLNIEIDYQKLADAIVDAQEKSKDRKPKNTRFRSSLMQSLNGIMYIAIASFSVIVIIKVWKDYLFTDLSALLLRIIMTVALAIIAILLFLAQQESLDDNNEDAHKFFSTNISLISLVIAVLALVYSLT